MFNINHKRAVPDRIAPYFFSFLVFLSIKCLLLFGSLLPICGEERCVTILKTAARETNYLEVTKKIPERSSYVYMVLKRVV